MTIRIVYGPSCAGKSTYCRENAGAEDVIVDFDAILSALGAAASHEASEAQKVIGFAARDAVISKILDGVDTDAWIIHSFIGAPEKARYEEAGAEFTLLNPGIEECLKRCEADGRPPGTEERIRQWYEEFEDEDLAKAGFFHMHSKGTKVKKTSAQIKIKAGPDDGLGEGIFTAYASVFGNVDSYGDIVVKGAFAKTLEEWKASGDVIPILFGHRMDDPDYNIGYVTDAVEDEHGLLVTAQLDLDSPKAAQVYRLLKGRRIRQMSFAYDVITGEPGKQDGQDVYFLREVKLHEVSIVPIGANQETEVLDVKQARQVAAEIKAGRVLAQKHLDSLRGAYEAIGAVLAAAETETEEGKASAPPVVKDETPDAGKSASPLASPVDILRLEMEIAALTLM